MLVGRGIPLFTLFGFRVRMDWSWLILFFLISWSLATGLFPHYYPDEPRQTYWIMGIVGALGLFFSSVLHELGHALAARRYGLEMRGITLFIFGGVAEMPDEPPHARSEFVIAIAGPLVSAALGVMSLALSMWGRTTGWGPGVVGVLGYLGWINLVLVGFNLVPAFPLDGGRVLRAILWGYGNNLKWATRIASTIGAGFGILLIVLGVFTFIGGNFIGGMWWFLLGLFLKGAADSSYQQVLIRRALAGEPVRRFMQPEVTTVPPTATLQEFVDDYVYRHHYKMFPVADNGTLRGCMTTGKLKELSRDEWTRHTVAELADPCSDENTIAPDSEAADALAKMNRQNSSRLIVVEQGKLRGIIGLKDLMKFISLKLELES